MSDEPFLDFVSSIPGGIVSTNKSRRLKLFIYQVVMIKTNAGKKDASNAPSKTRHKTSMFQVGTKAMDSSTAPHAITQKESQFRAPSLRTTRFPGSWL